MSAVRVVRAFLYRDRDCLLVFFVGVIFLGAAATEYLLTDLLVAAAPVVMLASFVAVSCVTSNAARRVVGQWGGAGGAICEDHLAFFAVSYWVARRLTRLEKPGFFFTEACTRTRTREENTEYNHILTKPKNRATTGTRSASPTRRT